MFRTQHLCPGSKNVFDSMAKTFFVSEQQNLFPQHMFPARLNWETFAMFPSLARPLNSLLPVPTVIDSAKFIHWSRFFHMLTFDLTHIIKVIVMKAHLNMLK